MYSSPQEKYQNLKTLKHYFDIFHGAYFSSTFSDTRPSDILLVANLTKHQNHKQKDKIFSIFLAIWWLPSLTQSLFTLKISYIPLKWVRFAHHLLVYCFNFGFLDEASSCLLPLTTVALNVFFFHICCYLNHKSVYNNSCDVIITNTYQSIHSHPCIHKPIMLNLVYINLW